jgi:hypothetical protein
MMRFDIFDSPMVRSTKTMGISRMRIRAFQVRRFISIWKE